jgi:hypothetical protein
VDVDGVHAGYRVDPLSIAEMKEWSDHYSKHLVEEHTWNEFTMEDFGFGFDDVDKGA